MSRRGNRTTRSTPATNNANVREEGSNTETGGAALPNVQEMFNHYMANMFRNAPGPAVGGVVAENMGVGGAVQPPRGDFSKLKGDFLKMGGKTFSGTETVVEVQEWLETCEEIFGDLELDDALK